MADFINLGPGKRMVSAGIQPHRYWQKTETIPTSSVSGLTAGSIPFGSSTGTLTQDNANFFWDDTNNRLGIGTVTPQRTLDVNGDIMLRQDKAIRWEENVGDSGPRVGISYLGSTGFYNIAQKWTNDYAITVNANGGKIGMGDSTPDAQLHIQTHTSTYTGLIVQGAASQSANLQEWQDSSGGIMSYVDDNGSFTIGDGTNTTAQGLTVKWKQNPSISFERHANGTGAVGIPLRILTKSSGNAGSGFGTELEFYGQNSTGNAYQLGAIQAKWAGATTEGSLHFLAGTSGAEEFLTILSDGNVGIGTTVPSSTLHVVGTATYGGENGQLIISPASDPSKKFQIGYDATVDAGFLAPMQTSGGWKNLLLAPSGGKVGIGTTAPSSTLHVIGDFQVSSTALYVSSTTGNVGIGTVSPATPLQIFNSGIVTTLGQLSNNLRLENTQNTTVGAGNEISFKGAGTALNTAIYGAISAPITAAGAGGTTGYISFSTKQEQVDTALTERMRVDASGNIGIGTNNPLSRLDVRSPGATNYVWRVSNASNTPIGAFYHTAAGHGGLYLNSSAGTENTFIAGSGNSYFNGGNVGIGETSPGAKLQVNTGAAATQGIIVKGAASQSGEYFQIQDSAGNQKFELVPGALTAPDLWWPEQVAGIKWDAGQNLEFYNNTIMAFEITTGGTLAGLSSVAISGTYSWASANGRIYYNSGTNSSNFESYVNSFYVADYGNSGDWYHAWFQASTEQMRLTTDGKLGIGTTAPDKALEINSATGANLRLTYNDSNGSAANYTDFSLDTGGGLAITTTANVIFDYSLAGAGTYIDHHSAGALLYFRANTLGTVKNGSIGVDTSGNLVVSQSTSGSMYFDYISGVNWRDGSFNTVMNLNTGALTVTGLEAANASLKLVADDGDDTPDTWTIRSTASTNNLDFINGTTELASITSGGHYIRSVGNALTAAGTTRTDALQLAKEVNNVTTAAAGTGVILPVGVIGMRIVIFNAGANPIQVYASASETIDGTAGSTGVPLTNAKRCEYFFVAANTWISAQMGVVSA